MCVMKTEFSTVPMKQVNITDHFWGNYMKLVRTKMIPYQWKVLNDQVEDADPSHCIQNFRIAAGLEQGEFKGFIFQDSDLAKWLEAAAYTLMTHPDKALEKTIDETIELIGKAQQPDGYLDTYYIINGMDKRWTNLRDNHEMYCAGHMLEAAVAYYQATGKRSLLDIMIRFVEHIARNFGVEPEKKKGYPGHEELELALLRLYDVTKEQRFLELAKYFIDQRGQQPNYFLQEAAVNGPAWTKILGLKYYQAHRPVRQQTEAEGHSVRAMYLYSAMASLAKQTDDDELRQACERLWQSTTRRRMYITGAIGSSEYGEAFTYDYDLPNDTVYGETCAAIGLVMFARRMLELSPKGEYGDVIERALYNGILSGTNLEGERFFYVNPLEVFPEACEKDARVSHVEPLRRKWFGCACCPPNLARTVASIGNYVYTQSKDALYVNLYIANTVHLSLNGVDTKLEVSGNYPWDGNISLILHPRESVYAKVALRIPAWCRSWSITCNGKKEAPVMEDGYCVLQREWKAEDCIELHMDMPVERMQSNPMVRENCGKHAVVRGPIVYCLEEIDNGKNLAGIVLPSQMKFKAVFEKELLGGVTALYSDGLRIADMDESLYSFAKQPSYQRQTLKWVPYYTWNNRGKGEMKVWVNCESKPLL